MKYIKIKYQKKSLIVLVFLLVIFLGNESVKAQIGQVITSFPSPADRPTGLAWDGQYLWNADIGTDKIYKINPLTGAVVYTIPVPSGASINGLTWDGNYLWCSDSQNDCLYKINVSDSSVIQTIYLQSTSPRGLTFDGNYLWYQDSGAKSVFKFDPSSGTIIDTMVSTGGYNRGLTLVDKYLWSTDRDKNEFYMIDTLRKSVVQIIDAPGTYSYGLAYDGEYLWNADYDTDTIYKISIRGDEKYKIWDSLQVLIRYTVKIKNVGTTTMDLQTYLACPFETSYQQLDDSVQFLHLPHNFIFDDYNQKIAYYQETVPIGAEKTYQYSVPTALSNIRYFLYPDSVGNISDIPQSIINMYTTDGDKYKITDPIIVNAVQQAIGNETNLYWQVRRIHDYVINHIYYLADGTWADAPTILTQGHGSCSEYSFLFISMCRAAGIPARYEGGGHLRDNIPYADSVFHRWQQVYFPDYGWVQIDCTWDDKEYPCNQARYFGALSNNTFSTTLGGGGKYGLWWTYNVANSSSGGSRQRDKLMEWLPYVTSIEIAVEPLPQDLFIVQNYPNPFNNRTSIQYQLPVSSNVKIKIFNSVGQLITVINEGFLRSGIHAISWDARNESRIEVSSGIYYYKIESKIGNYFGRMILIK